MSVSQRDAGFLRSPAFRGIGRNATFSRSRAESPARPSYPTHVVIVADHGHINGGQAKVAIDSAIGLARRGYRVTFFVAVGPVDPRLAEAGVEITCLEQLDIATASGFGGQMQFLAQTMWNGEARRKL